MTAWNTDLVARYKEWHWAQVRTGDLDPMYPWLRAYTGLTGCDKQEAAALTLTYLTWYHAGSGVRAWQSAGRQLPNPDRVPHLPTGTERRAHRSRTQLLAHITDLTAQVGDDPHGWLTGASTWQAATDRFMGVHGNGRWAAYKGCDLATKVHDAPWTAPDAGHAYSTGPRKCLALLGVDDPGGNSPEVIAHLDAATAELSDIVGDPDLSQIETSLCDFRSYLKGRHPLGHDVHGLAEQVRDIPQGIKAMRVAELAVTP